LTKGERLRNTPGKDHTFIAPRDGGDEAVNGNAEETPKVRGRRKNPASDAKTPPKKRKKTPAAAGARRSKGTDEADA
jgi:hypothetical protein